MLLEVHKEETVVHLTAVGESSLTDNLIVAISTAIVGVAVLGLVGHRLAYRWEDRKRLREGDLAALIGFYRLYGEFFATWKLWDSHKRHHVNSANLDRVQWELLSRAEATEGGFEALLVKLASERRLGTKDRTLIACFREAYQMLRECIRKDANLEWWASQSPAHTVGHRQYRAYKALAEYIASTLEATGPARRSRPGKVEAIGAILAVTSSAGYRGRWWEVAEVELALCDDSGPCVSRREL